MTMILDTREPDPHPWAPFWPGVAIERAGLPTGDVCLSGNPGVVVERKTAVDLCACIGAERERFERELRRACQPAAACRFRFLSSVHPTMPKAKAPA